jgi:hypothetical protein
MHVCGPDCQCKIELQKASEALSKASRFLLDSVWGNSDDALETAFVDFRSRSAKFKGALLDYREYKEVG